MLFVSHDLKEAAGGPKASEYTLAPGATKLPCLLETKIISDVEGHFTCRVTTNVYDTATGRHLLVPQGSTVLGNDQANTLVYGSNRMDTVSLTLALPDGRTVDLGRAPVTDSQGVAGLTGDVNNHYVKLFGAVLIGGALKGGMSAFQIAAAESAGAGQVTAGVTALGNQATTRAVQPYINIRPTITVEAGALCTVLLLKPLHLPAMWQGTTTHRNTEVGMTKAERLAAKIQRDKDTLEKQRQVLAESEATLRAEIRHSEAALRDEERKATDKRRYQVGALAEEAGLFAMSNTELAEVFAALGALRAGERPGAVLEALVGYPERFSEGSENGTGHDPVLETGREKDAEKSLAR